MTQTGGFIVTMPRIRQCDLFRAAAIDLLGDVVDVGSLSLETGVNQCAADGEQARSRSVQRFQALRSDFVRPIDKVQEHSVWSLRPPRSIF
jgi:hypothetical protein